jgi:hypothetical protein
VRRLGCIRTIGAVGTQFSPAACLAALLRAAADSGVPREQGVEIIAQTVRGWGLIFPELDALKRQEGARAVSRRLAAVMPPVGAPGSLALDGHRVTRGSRRPSIPPISDRPDRGTTLLAGSRAFRAGFQNERL